MTGIPGDPTAAEPRSGTGTAARRLLLAIPRFVLDWLPVAIVLFVYDAIHNRLGAFIPTAHTWPQIRADAALFGSPIPTLRWQHAFYASGHPRWWDFATLAVYSSHFFVSVLIGLWLWPRARHRYLRFMVGFVALTTAGYVTYVLFPAVPPWLASQHGDLAPTHRLVRELWDALGWHAMANTFSGTNVLANDVAAIPSLHAAYPVMIAMSFWRDSRPLTRAAMLFYAVAMALALVYAAEHYVADILLGWLYALLVGLGMARVWPQPSARSPARRHGAPA